MIRASYYPGAEVWQHPNAEKTFATVNECRRAYYGLPPLVRDKSSTEDVIRERLWEKEKWDREVRRLKRKRGESLAEA